MNSIHVQKSSQIKSLAIFANSLMQFILGVISVKQWISISPKHATVLREIKLYCGYVKTPPPPPQEKKKKEKKGTYHIRGWENSL